MTLKDFVEVYHGNIFLIWGGRSEEFHEGEIPDNLLKMKVLSIYKDRYYHLLTVRATFVDDDISLDDWLIS